MANEALEPRELVIELRTGLRITVWQIKAAHKNSVYGPLDVAAVRILVAARQLAACFDGLTAAGQDGHTVPGFLPVPHSVVTSRVDGHHREHIIGRLQLLEADDVRLFALQPLEKVPEPRADSVDVESGDF